MKQILIQILARCARLYLRRHKPYLIGITGSVGKTTCRMVITHVMRQLLPSLRIDTSEKNFNSDIGLCLAILGIQSYSPTLFSTLRTLVKAFGLGIFGTQRAEVMVLEYGIDHPGDMHHLVTIATPHIAVLTGIDKVHAVYFPDDTAILKEKAILLQAAREVVLSPATLKTVLEPFLKHLAVDKLSFALRSDEVANIGFSDYTYQRVDESVTARFTLRQEHDFLSEVQTNLLGEAQAGYISLGVELAMIVAQRFGTQVSGVSEEKTLHVEARLQEGRTTILSGKWGSLLLDSSYNAAPTSMQMLIDLVTQIRQELFPDRELILCLGEMRELGQYSKQAHRDLAQQITHADKIFLVGEEMKQYLLPKLLELGYRQDRVQHFVHSRIMGEALDEYLSAAERLAIVLFKGSQNTIFLEEAIKVVLRNPDDVVSLCRQSKRWLQKKGIFFQSV